MNIQTETNIKALRDAYDRLSKICEFGPTIACGLIKKRIAELEQIQNKTDYRLWPNVLVLNEAIFILDRKIEACQDESERIGLKLKRASLASQRYDQIQFNKELAQKEAA